MSRDAIDDEIMRKMRAVGDALKARPGLSWPAPYVFSIWRGGHPSSFGEDDESPVRPNVFWITTPADERMPLMAEQIWSLERSRSTVFLMGNVACVISTPHSHDALDPVQVMELSLLVLPWGVTLSTRDYAYLTARIVANDVPPRDPLVLATRQRPEGWPP